jgi:mannose-6-phosphate isomerase-like protein (cupin superfamily)
MKNLNPIHTEYNKAETFVFPGAITLRILLSGSDTEGQLAIFEDIVEPGIGPGRHIHHNQNETFFFLEGKFIAEIAGQMFEFKPGDIAFIPKGTIHAFKNIGNTPGKLRYVFSPALTIETMFMEFYKTMNEDALTFERMTEIALIHGQEFVGPPL